MSVKDRYEAQAAAWQASGRPGALLPQGWRLLGLYCWSHSEGGRHEDLTPTLRAFLQAAEEAESAGWIEDLLDERESCRHCGETFHAENLQLCTDCMTMCCHRCAATQPMAVNGNRLCSCGGEWVG